MVHIVQIKWHPGCIVHISVCLHLRILLCGCHCEICVSFCLTFTHMMMEVQIVLNDAIDFGSCSSDAGMAIMPLVTSHALICRRHELTLHFLISNLTDY